MLPRAAALRVALSASVLLAGCGRESAVPAERSSAAVAPVHSHGTEATGTSGSTAPRKRYDGPLPPLPQVAFTPPRTPDVVRATYEFAARRPDVLQYVPCFCMCERSGHIGNDDCFVKSRDASGKPTWDLHGMG